MPVNGSVVLPVFLPHEHIVPLPYHLIEKQNKYSMLSVVQFRHSRYSTLRFGKYKMELSVHLYLSQLSIYSRLALEYIFMDLTHPNVMNLIDVLSCFRIEVHAAGLGSGCQCRCLRGDYRKMREVFCICVVYLV